MNDTQTYQAVRIADTADWRMVCSVGAAGMGAWLRHNVPGGEILGIFREEWNEDPEALLGRIENAVYDHPQVLDDFSCDIVVHSARPLWVPTADVDDDDDEASRLHTLVYGGLGEDVMADRCGEETCLYTLAPGLKGFLQRTFAGANVVSKQGVMVRKLRERSADMPRVYADIGPGTCDFTAFDREALLLGACHRWRHPNDIGYHLLNILRATGLDPETVQVSVSGLAPVKAEVLEVLRPLTAYAKSTPVPGAGARAGMSLAEALLK